MTRPYNFSAGPATLPEPVLQRAREEMLDWQGSGMSVMEMSHRGKEFLSIAAQAETDIRDLLNIPSDYKVLFLQGGASIQFSMVPLNIPGSSADYINTGSWSKKAIAEAKRLKKVNVAASSEDQNFTTVPERAEWNCNPAAAYLHYTHNETIGGVEFDVIPEVSVPLISDMSSTLLSRPLDVSRFAVIYAGAQKNIGPAGLTIVIVNEAVLGQCAESTPAMLNYQTHANADSMYNTPPTYAWYLAGLVFQWLKGLGGLTAIAEHNQVKAKLLYNFIDQSGFYTNPVEPRYRSWMNVPFILADDGLNERFLSEARQAQLLTLKGHRSVGGMRASIYNAMPLKGVQTLVDFMAEFQRRYG